MDILQRIRDLYPEFTRKQKGIADFLLENPEDVCYITLAQLSQQTSSSELTLLRFCEKVGCSGFLDLKNEFRDYTQNMIRTLSAPAYFVPDDASFTGSGKTALLMDICRQEAASAAEFASAFSPEELIRAADEIRKSRRIFIFAHDISKVLGEFLQARLRLLYCDAILTDLSDLSDTQERLEKLKEGDLAIFFSFPKYYYPIGNIAKKAARKGIPILTITDSPVSPAAKYSTHLLVCQTATKMFYNSLTLPMTMLNLLTSCLVIDMVPASEREEFKETSSF